MNVENKINEVQELINKIKKHSDDLNVNDRISALELSVIISKIAKLHEAALILKYLVKKEHGVTITDREDEIEEMASSVTSNEELIINNTELAFVEEVEADEDNNAIEAMMEGMEEEAEDLIEEEVVEDEIEAPSLQDNSITEELTSTNIEEEVEDEPIDEEESVTSFFDEVLEKEEESISMEDIESKEEFSSSPDLNERFSANDDNSVGDHLQKQPIVDLISSIGINEQYLYSSELFNGEMTDFKRSIQLLNDFETGEAAKDFFQNELKPSYGWTDDNEFVSALYGLVERRYL